ncbi:TenA family protein [Geofilum sp. OHC36d9]|uniref:TenA family protein n=1 Tax=Geofilum sp. OHC36d9 TaxID=3458413 RepID=UPI00403367F6
MKKEPPFSKLLWNNIIPIYDEIIHCDFIKELIHGTLPDNNFAHYLAQALLHLKKNNEALMAVAERTSQKHQQLFFKKLGDDGIKMETIMRIKYLAHFAVQETPSQSPIFKKYSEFQLSHANHSSFNVALAALLPSFWIHTEYGKIIRLNTIPDNPYQKFIEMYSGPEITGYNKKFIEIVDEEAQKTSDEGRENMRKIFITATQYELDVFHETMNIQ